MNQISTGYKNMTSAIDGNTTTEPSSMPREMSFTDDSLVSVVTYTVLFIIAAIGNLLVFITLLKHRHRRSRVNLFILHLCIADMIVTFIMLPMEIGWHLTVSWKAGDFGCRILMFFRAFGFYLSSFILIVISLDRYIAIAHPLSLIDAGRRGKVMLCFAWLCSLIASVPQSVIFHEANHPLYKQFKQCVTFNFFPSTQHELAYNLFNIIMLYALPLVVITISYSLTLFEITKKTRESRRQSRRSLVEFSSTKKEPYEMRRSGIGKIEKARRRTLIMTIVIVFVFIICWTPYFVISAWWWIDKSSASELNPKIMRGLFIFAVSNACMNPIVYGMFTTVFRRDLQKMCRAFTSQLSKCVCVSQESSSSIPMFYANTHAVVYSEGRTQRRSYPRSRQEPIHQELKFKMSSPV